MVLSTYLLYFVFLWLLLKCMSYECQCFGCTVKIFWWKTATCHMSFFYMWYCLDRNILRSSINLRREAIYSWLLNRCTNYSLNVSVFTTATLTPDFYLLAIWQFNTKESEWRQGGMESQVWDRACVSCVLQFGYHGERKRGRSFFLQIADLPEPPVDHFQQSWVAVIVRCPVAAASICTSTVFWMVVLLVLSSSSGSSFLSIPYWPVITLRPYILNTDAFLVFPFTLLLSFFASSIEGAELSLEVHTLPFFKLGWKFWCSAITSEFNWRRLAFNDVSWNCSHHAH